MNNQQKKKLQKLKIAATDLETPVADATNALNAAESDEDKKAAQTLLDEAMEARDKAKQAADEYETSVQPKTSKTDDEAAPKAKAKKSNGDVITVVASADRRRAGRSFPRRVEVEIPRDELSDDQLQALRDDPVLAVSGD